MNEGARGVKLHPMAQGFKPSHRRLEEVYEYCSDVRFPVVFHCGGISDKRLNEYSDIKMILPIIEKFSDMPVILAHMAGVNAREAVGLSKNYGNIYFDTSIIITGYPPIAEVNKAVWTDDDEVADVINSIGAHRILFGSDYPWGSPSHDIQRLMKMRLSDEQKRLVLGENAIRVFGLL